MLKILHLKKAVKHNLLSATTDFSRVVQDLDAISICVPTPLNKEKNPDISYIVSVMEEIKNYIHENMLIVLESTTYPEYKRSSFYHTLLKIKISFLVKIYACVLVREN